MTTRSGASRESSALIPGGTRRCFQFAHGTMRGHTLAGEERFALEWDKGGDGSVWFDIFTVSRPAHPVSVMTYPLVRFYQNRRVSLSLSRGAFTTFWMSCYLTIYCTVTGQINARLNSGDRCTDYFTNAG